MTMKSSSNLTQPRPLLAAQQPQAVNSSETESLFSESWRNGQRMGGVKRIPIW